MKKLFLLSWLLCTVPAFAQTTFYFPVSTAADVDVSPQTGWEETSEVEKRKLAHNKGSSSITTGQTVDITEDTGNQDLDRQYVSARMNAGVTFTSGVTSVTSYIMMREYAATDDVTMCILGIRVMDSAGTTLLATLLSVASYGSGTEMVNNATHRNQQCANGDTVTASYTTSLGDRLVIEIGYQTDGAETSPQASAKWGENATDCAENETNTTDCAGWIRFSNSITFETTVPAMSTLQTIVFGGATFQSAVTR